MRAWLYLWWFPHVSLDLQDIIDRGKCVYLTFQSASYQRCKGAVADHRRQ